MLPCHLVQYPDVTYPEVDDSTTTERETKAGAGDTQVATKIPSVAGCGPPKAL